jgi:hypothetical protein
MIYASWRAEVLSIFCPTSDNRTAPAYEAENRAPGPGILRDNAGTATGRDSYNDTVLFRHSRIYGNPEKDITIFENILRRAASAETLAFTRSSSVADMTSHASFNAPALYLPRTQSALRAPISRAKPLHTSGATTRTDAPARHKTCVLRKATAPPPTTQQTLDLTSSNTG